MVLVIHGRILYSFLYTFYKSNQEQFQSGVRGVQSNPSDTVITQLFARLTLYIVLLIKFTSLFYYLSVCQKLLDEWLGSFVSQKYPLPRKDHNHKVQPSLVTVRRRAV